MRRSVASLVETLSRRPTGPESAFGCMVGWGSWTEGDRLHAREA